MTNQAIMATVQAKDFDPSRKYKINLSERLSGKDSYGIAAIQRREFSLSKHKSVLKAFTVDPDLKLPPTVRNATISSGFNSNECQLSLVSSVDGKESLYNGKSTKSKGCALIYDHSKGSFTLEQIDTQFSFNSSNNSPVEMSEASMLAAMIEEVGAPEADNPFDWRHQLQRERTPTPDYEQFRLDTGTTTSSVPSPATRPLKARPRQASSPPGMSIEFEEEEQQQQPTSDREVNSQQEDYEMDDDDDDNENSDEGGLQISWDGASKPKGFRGRFSTRKPDGPPTSLRSAANSQSPAIRRGDSISESDADVDEMQLSNPSVSRKAAVTVEFDSAEGEVEAAVDMNNNNDDDDDDMEAEFERALKGDDEDDDRETPVTPPPPPHVEQTYVVDDESSSESEEE